MIFLIATREIRTLWISIRTRTLIYTSAIHTSRTHTHTHAPSHFIHSIIIIIITISLVREGIHIDIYDSAHHWMLIAFMRNIINISSFRSPFYMNIEYEYVKAQCAMLFGCRSVWYSSTFIAFVDIAFQAFGINSFVWLMLITRWIRNGKQFQSMLIHILFFRSTSLSPFTISSVWLCVCVCYYGRIMIMTEQNVYLAVDVWCVCAFRNQHICTANIG